MIERMVSFLSDLPMITLSSYLSPPGGGDQSEERPGRG
jgi:hypothetical protein